MRRKCILALVGLAIVCLSGDGAAVAEVTIRFDPPSLPGGGKIINQWVEQGVLFTGPNGLAHYDSGIANCPDNGTAYLKFMSGPPMTLFFQFTDERPFQLLRLDLAEYSTVFPEPRTITFIGYKTDTTTVTQDFTVDGIIDGTGPLADFETFTFREDFKDLIYVEVPTLLYSLDNLVLSTESAPSEKGTGFTYQGRMIDADSVADGLYDFEFKLYNAPSGGSQEGNTVTIDEVDVIDGYFTVKLDFGGDVFAGEARWLEIGVRSGELEDPSVYTTLSPRVELTPTPYAIYAQSAEDADTLDGLHASSFLGPGSDYGRSGVSSILYEGTTALVNKYLGRTATATNADRLDGQHGSYYQSASSINSGTLSNARFSARSDLSSEGYLGNASGDIAQNNGIRQVNLNADMVDGLHASSFLSTGSDYGRYGVSSTLYESTTALVNKYLGKTATATNADKLDLQHGSYYRNATNLNAGTISESRLPQNAIDSTELQNGGVIDADLAGGISASKISGTAWTHSADGYAPRIAVCSGRFFRTTSSTYVTMCSRTITLPTSGYIFAVGSTSFAYDTGSYSAYVGIGFDSTSPDQYTYRGGSIDSGTKRNGVCASYVRYMSSGSHTIRFMVRRYEGTGQVFLPSYTLTVMFIDLGSTGAAAAEAEAVMEPILEGGPEED